MKLIAYRHNGVRTWGAVVDDTVHDLALGPDIDAVAELAMNGKLQFADGIPALPIEQVDVLPPVDRHRKVLCVGLNYADHIREMNREFPSKPTIFTRFVDSLVASGENLVKPRSSDKFDFEGEFCVVIGRGGRFISPGEASQHILGYTLMNDGSIRDYQRHTTQFTPGKNFPASGSLGPSIVTTEEFGSLGTQRIRTLIGDEVLQDSTLDELVFDVDSLVAYISEWTELAPGDVIATGTPGGVGDGRNPPRYLRSGDTVSIHVDGMPVLTNRVVEDDRAPKKRTPMNKPAHALKKLTVQRQDELPMAPGQTHNARRYSGVSVENTEVEGLWYGKVITGPGEASDPHHHGEAETGGYILSGAGYIRFGDRFDEIVYMNEGDFVYVPPFVPHIEGNLSRTQDLIWLTTRTPDNIVVNLPDQDVADIAIEYVD